MAALGGQVGTTGGARRTRLRNHLLTPPARTVRVVCLGGGTGLPAVLKGLSDPRLGRACSVRLELTAVVAMADDGGSSGRLRRARGGPPPGDVRNCLLALASPRSPLRSLFRYRFDGSRDVAGHVVGNLMLTALAELKGDFLEAVRCAGELLEARGRVLPSTVVPVRLSARRLDGSEVLGERHLARGAGRLARVWLVPRQPPPTPGLLEAIADADLITLGPGSLFSSVLPNLLVDGVAQALRGAQGRRILIANLMTQPGETAGMDLGEHVRAILDHAGPVLDAVLLNTRPPAPALLSRYAARGAEPLLGPSSHLDELGLQALGGQLLADGPRIRHDPRRVARCLLSWVCAPM